MCKFFNCLLSFYCDLSKIHKFYIWFFTITSTCCGVVFLKWQMAQKKQHTCHRRCVHKDTTPVLFAIQRVLLLRSYIMLRIVLLSFGQFYANKITLKPQGFNNTFDLSKISLQISICNITYTHRRKYFQMGIIAFKVYNPLWHFQAESVTFLIQKIGRHFITKCLPINFICP